MLEIKQEDLLYDFFRVDPEIRITHIPTGIVVSCNATKSKNINKEIALTELKLKVLKHQCGPAKEDKEIIIASAIWYKDFPNPEHGPINITQGVVLCGLRHNHITGQMHSISGKKTVTFGDNAAGEHEQGFLTNKDRFVDRYEAAKIAFEAGQTKEISNKGLFSEDLW